MAAACIGWTATMRSSSKGGLTYYFRAAGRTRGRDPGRGDRRPLPQLAALRARPGRPAARSSRARAGGSSLLQRAGLLRSITLHHPDFPERRTLVRFAYDGDDNLTAVYDALDHPYSFGWDDRHRLVRHTNRTGLSFYYEYDAESRCVHSWGDGGSTTTTSTTIPSAA